jgi:TolB-like protein/DNA-binding winged helix-turn-helix (wHTH) protein/Tfp pilus assembly protein PilF
MEESVRQPPAIRFGVFEVDLRAGELRKQGLKVRLEEKPFQVLALLLEHPAEVITREELQQRLWAADTFVDFDRGLNTAIHKLREALDDSANTPRFVETLPRRGYRFIAPVERQEQAVPKSRTRVRAYWIAALAVVALVAMLLGLNVSGLRDRLLGRPAPGQITSIAVLPLENLSGDPEQEYFVDGMHEELILALAKIGALKVISRTSTMQYKEARKPLPEIAQELGVDGVIEGSVRRAGNQVRITVQLIDARTEKHLWADTYQQELRDILALQSEVARAIASEIKIVVAPAEEARLASTRRVGADVYDLYLMGRYYSALPTEERLEKGIEYFRQAIDLDPTYAPAYAKLSSCYSDLSLFGYRPPQDMYPKAKVAALKARELDDALTEAHIALGAINLRFDWDWQGAEREFKQALELNPNSVDALYMYNEYLVLTGRFDEGIAANKRAIELDPLSPSMSVNLGWSYFKARRYDDAIAQFKKTLELAPNFFPAHMQLAWSYAVKGMHTEAIAEAEKALAYAPANAPVLLGSLAWVYAVVGRRAKALELLSELNDLAAPGYAEPVNLAFGYAGLGEKDLAFEWLRRGYEERSTNMIFLKVEPLLDSLRDDPRFQDLLRRLDFP